MSYINTEAYGIIPLATWIAYLLATATVDTADEAHRKALVQHGISFADVVFADEETV